MDNLALWILLLTSGSICYTIPLIWAVVILLMIRNKNFKLEMITGLAAI